MRTFRQVVQEAEKFYASDPIGYFLYRDGRMAVLKFFGEDSFGQGTGSRGCCVVGGYMTDVATWLELSRDWKVVLSSEPRIDYFRMRNCYDLSGPFDEWSRKEADIKLDSLVSVIEKHGKALYGADSIITWDAFNHGVLEVNPEAAILAFSHPYYFCALGAMRAAVETVASFGTTVSTHFTFDRQVGMENVVAQAFGLIRENRPELQAFLGDLTFSDDRQVIPLQCADLLAWHSRRDYIKPIEDHGRTRAEWERLQRGLYGYRSLRWSEESLREFFTKAKGIAL